MLLLVIERASFDILSDRMHTYGTKRRVAIRPKSGQHSAERADVVAKQSGKTNRQDRRVDNRCSGPVISVVFELSSSL